MEAELARAWAQLTGRITGPLMLRFILQPTVAAILAVRAGLADARAGRPAYLWAVFTNRDARRSLILSGWRDVGKVFVFSCVLDVVYQLVEFRWLYPPQTLIIACLLAIVPYVVIRGPATRIGLWWSKGSRWLSSTRPVVRPRHP